jgi:hypothetical protein
MTTAKPKRQSNVVEIGKAQPTKSAWDLVCDMEEDVSAIERFADALLIMCAEIEEAADPQLALAFFQIIHTTKGHIRRVEERQGKLFHVLHPNRDVPWVRANLETGEAAS